MDTTVNFNLSHGTTCSGFFVDINFHAEKIYSCRSRLQKWKMNHNCKCSYNFQCDLVVMWYMFKYVSYYNKCTLVIDWSHQADVAQVFQLRKDIILLSEEHFGDEKIAWETDLFTGAFPPRANIRNSQVRYLYINKTEKTPTYIWHTGHKTPHLLSVTSWALLYPSHKAIYTDIINIPF